jgi:hypothetical protein
MITLREQVLNKLRTEIHVSFISEVILKLPMDKTIELMEDLVSDGFIDNLGNGYYILKKNKNGKIQNI